MKALHIGHAGSSAFDLPVELATGSIAILAIKGSGKTYTSAVITEELIDKGVPVTIIDPTGVHWGLKSSATGKSAGFPVTIFGGDHADLPLEEGAGEVLARWTVERRFCSILDLSHFRKAQIYRFLTPFLLELYRLNRSPMHLVADEADLYAPQRAFPDVARCLGAMEDIVRRGRARGIGTTLITQRPASLNKDVLTQCDCLMALRISHPRDIAPVMEWIDQHGDRKTAEKMLASLPSLPTGTAWVWAPRADIFDRIQIRKRTTFDSSSTPKIGQEKMEPAVFAKIDLEELGKEITDSVQRAKDNDPKELKAKIRLLEAEIAKKPVTLPAPAPKRIEVPLLSNEERAVLEKLSERAGLIVLELNGWRERITPILSALKPRPHDTKLSLPQETADKPLPRGMTRVEGANPMRFSFDEKKNQAIGKCERAVLTALAQFGPSQRSRVAVLSGYSVQSGSFANALSVLRTAGFIEGLGQEPIAITEAGVKHLGPYKPLPTGPELIEYWAGRMDRCAKMIIEYLCQQYPRACSRDDIAAATGYSVESGSFANSLSVLRGLELINRGAPIKASDNLFQ